MTPSRRPTHRAPWFLALLLGAVVLLGGTLAWWMARSGVRGALHVVLVTPAGAAERAGLDPAQVRAIGALVQDHLEHWGGFAVTSLTRLPEDLASLQGRPRTLLVELQLRREGDRLVLGHRHAWDRDLSRGLPAAWRVQEAQPEAPAQAFETFARTFPRRMESQGRPLLPQSPAVFWDLVQAAAWRLRNQRLEDSVALAERATRQAPDCPTAWILLGNLKYRQMLNHPGNFRQEMSDAEAQIQRGLELAPGHPRGVFLHALLLSDSGNQQAALDLLVQARRRQPHNPTLLTGVAYAARGAGLLPLAQAAMDLRDRLAYANLQPQAVDITRLYTGEVDRFEASLQERPGHLRSASGVLPFYRGYLALVKGDRARALAAFKEASVLENGYPNIRRLSEIYALILEGNREEAWNLLREYDQERTGMREPDGEFTIRLAEAYALMGDRASAMDMASRAFARGFGCTAWYERSPMLEPLRSLPKWKALLQHLRERQALMEDRFPVGLLEEN